MRETGKDYGKKISILKNTPDKLKELLDAPKSYSYGRLKDNVLNKAIEEINLKIEDMNLQLQTEKKDEKLLV